MSNLRTFISCLFGPRIQSFYKLTGNTLSSSTPEVLSRSHQYKPSTPEALSDYVIRASKLITSFGTYFTPAIISYLIYKRNSVGSYANSLDTSVLLQLITTAFSILVASYGIRGLARFSNPDYQSFLRVIKEVQKNPNASNKRILNHFDCDFSAFPVDYRWSESSDSRPPAPYQKSFPNQTSQTPLLLEGFPLKLPLELVLSIVMKTVGRRLIYPGSLDFLQTLMHPAISSGRARLIEEYNGMRYKLESYDGNHIDSIFIDRRSSTPNGEFLVIGCEGNGGFYELGTILTPLEAGYSVLGWNHPGFGGSTGIPYPDQEVAAVDTVIKFAQDKLKFKQNQIIIYGWSIGGFTATWLGMRYPNVHGLIIDASFDHILPLARNIFPTFMYPVIEMAIRQHFDLNNSRHLEHYRGPILIIRRSQDEVIATDPFNSPPTNRANYLLIDTLRQRFPMLIDARAETLLREYLGGNARYQDGVLKRYSVNNTNCLRLLFEYFHINQTSYPVNIGPDLDNVSKDQLVLFLASRHLTDYDSVHCAPLPPRYFQRPWNLINIASTSGL